MIDAGYIMMVVASIIAGIVANNFFMRISTLYRYNLEHKLKEEKRLPTVKEIVKESLVGLPHSFILDIFLAGLLLFFKPIPYPFNDILVFFFLGSAIPDIPYAKKRLSKYIKWVALLFMGSHGLELIYELLDIPIPPAEKLGGEKDIKTIILEMVKDDNIKKELEKKIDEILGNQETQG